MNEDDVIKRSDDYRLAEMEIKSNIPSPEIFDFLRIRKATGELKISLFHGGIRRITLVERTKISPNGFDPADPLLKTK